VKRSRIRNGGPIRVTKSVLLVGVAVLVLVAVGAAMMALPTLVANMPRHGLP
jgi:hypothetical protein